MHVLSSGTASELGRAAVVSLLSRLTACESELRACVSGTPSDTASDCDALVALTAGNRRVARESNIFPWLVEELRLSQLSSNPDWLLG